MIALVALFLGCPLAGAEAPPILDEFARIRKLAVERSPELGIAAATASQKRYQVWTAVARWAPQVSLQVNYATSLNNQFLTNGALGPAITLGSGLNPQESRLWGWNLGANLPLYKRSVQLGVQQALSEQSFALTQLDSKLHELDWRLRQLFGAYLLQAYREETLKASIRAATTNLKDARLRFNQGQNTKVDVLRAEANLVSLQSRDVTYRQQKLAALADLLEYTGIERSELASLQLDRALKDETAILRAIEALTDFQPALKALAPYLGEDPAPRERRIVDESPYYRSTMAQEALSFTQAAGLAATEYPDLSFQANVNNQGQQIATAFTNGATISWSYGLYVSIPLNPGLTLVSTAIQERRGKQIAEVQRDRDVRHFRNEIENDRIRIEALSRSLESLKLTVAQDLEIARLSEKTYQLGKTTMVELLGSENSLTEAKVNLAQTEVDLAVLVHKMAWNLGVTAE